MTCTYMCHIESEMNLWCTRLRCYITVCILFPSRVLARDQSASLEDWQKLARTGEIVWFYKWRDRKKTGKIVRNGHFERAVSESWLNPCFPVLNSFPRRDLARNEEFSEIAVINIFFTVLKTKTQLYVGGGVLRGKFRDKSSNWHVNKQEGYEHSHRPVCQYTTPCVVIGLNVIAIDKYNYMNYDYFVLTPYKCMNDTVLN